MTVRSATTADAARLLEIYSWYVKNTAITFEYDAPDAGQYKERIRNILKDFPFLVAEEDGKIIGYAYAGRVRTRAAYQHCVETSVYISRAQRRSGAGRLLYDHRRSAHGVCRGRSAVPVSRIDRSADQQDRA